MKQEIQLSKELEKLKSDPHYIDLFCKHVSEQAGENHEFIKSLLDEAIAFYHKEEYPENYIKLISMALKEKLILGEFNEVVQLGETVLEDLKSDDRVNEFEIWHDLLVAYTEMGLFEKAHFYKNKLVDAIGEESPTSKYIDMMLSIIKLYIKSQVYEEARALLMHLEKLRDWMTPKQVFNKHLLQLELLLKENQIDEAIEVVKQAYHAVSPFEKEKSHLYELSEVLRLRGILNQKRNLHLQAEKDFKLASQYAKGYKGLYVKCLMNFANFFIANEQYEEAKEKIHLVVQIAEQSHMKDIVSQASEALSKIDEMNAHWKKAYEHLKKSKDQAVKPCEIKSTITPVRSIKGYEKSQDFLSKIVHLGQVFTQTFSLENLQETIQKELSPLIEMDLMGIGIVEKGKIQYKVYDLCEEWINGDDELVKYTYRLLEHCIQFQMNVTIQDGDFSEYTLKTIEHTETGKKLNSAIVKLLRAEGQVIGAMFIGSYQTEVYTHKDIEMAQIIASYMGLNLKNTHLYDKISYLKEHDSLTGLLSRSVVMKNGEKLFKENHKKHKKTAIMMLDTDRFKLVNTKYGYVLGDEVLSRIGEIICKSVRYGDYVGRYGSKAFIIILDNPMDQEIVDMAEKIKKSLAESTFETKKDKNIKITLSGGIYICNEYTLNFDDAIRYADHALYRAKLLGSNRIINYNITENKR